MCVWCFCAKSCSVTVGTVQYTWTYVVIVICTGPQLELYCSYVLHTHTHTPLILFEVVEAGAIL